MKPLMIAALMAATPALADCPTGADLATGIRITETDGTVQVYQQAGPGVVQVDLTWPDGSRSRNLLARGTHVLQLADIENGSLLPDSIVNTAYPVGAADLPLPTPNGRWDVQTTVRGYGEIYREDQSQRWGPLAKFTIGACSYAVLDGKVTYTSDDDFVITEGIYYFTDLGIGLLYSYDDTETDPDTYTFRSIEAVR